MHIVQLRTDSPLQNFTYLVLPDNPENRLSAVVIDPWDADQVMEALEKEGRRLSLIVNTHEHDDHTRGNAQLVELTGAEVWAHPRGEGRIPHFSRGLSSGDKIEFSENEYLIVLDTPGHTFAHLSLLAVHHPKPFAVITGDTLFNAGVGNCKHGGDPKTLFKTIEEEFLPLDDDILLYPGHDYLLRNLEFSLSLTPHNDDMKKLKHTVEHQPNMIVNLGVEKKVNQFFRLDDVPLRQALQKRNPELKSPQREDVFIELRRLRDSW